jgi:tight adherence protein C
MKSISLTLVFACLVLATIMFIEVAKNRGKLYSRIAGLAPGANSISKESGTKRIRKLSKELASEVDFQLTEFAAMLVAVLQSGQSLFVALDQVTEISGGALSRELKYLSQRLNLGGQMSVELSALCERVPTDSIREFANKLSLAIARGTPLAESLLSLSVSLRAKRTAKLLQQAGVNETKMLIPVVLLICPVTVVFALYPSSQSLSLGLI